MLLLIIDTTENNRSWSVADQLALLKKNQNTVNPLKTRQNLAEISRNELCHPLHNQKKIPVFFLLSITIVYNKLFKQITQNVVILQN